MTLAKKFAQAAALSSAVWITVVSYGIPKEASVKELASNSTSRQEGPPIHIPPPQTPIHPHTGSLDLELVGEKPIKSSSNNQEITGFTIRTDHSSYIKAGDPSEWVDTSDTLQTPFPSKLSGVWLVTIDEGFKGHSILILGNADDKTVPVQIAMQASADSFDPSNSLVSDGYVITPYRHHDKGWPFHHTRERLSAVTIWQSGSAPVAFTCKNSKVAGHCAFGLGLNDKP